MKVIIYITTFFTASFCFSQTYNKELLQKKNNEIRLEIKKLNEDLNKIKEESKTSILYFTQLTSKIQARTKLINNTSKEKVFIEDEIYLKQLNINKLKRELLELRKEYSGVLINSYKNRSVQNKMLFILTSKDLGQALRRLKYLEKYGEYQKNKSNEIINKQKQIEKSIEQKEKAKKEKESILANQEKEIKTLDLEKQEKEKIVQKFKNDENGILTKIKEKQKNAIFIEKEIEKSIKEEIALAKAKEKEEAKKREDLVKTKKEEERKNLEEAKKENQRKLLEAKAKKEEEKKLLALAKKEEDKKRLLEAKQKREEEEKRLFAEKKNLEKQEIKDFSKNNSNIDNKKIEEKASISENFSSNKKNIPWPVDGTIVSKFGSQPHPVIPNITMNNAGIEIATSKGAVSRAVFQGEIFKIQSIPGGNKAVMINHGDYYTIYTNLEEIYVKTGDKVSTKQSIGKIYTDDSGSTIAGFQLWKGTTKIDPLLWLSN